MATLYVVGFGPGGYADMSHRAEEAILSADLVMGYTTYVHLLQPLFPQKEFLETPMRRERERCEMAIAQTAAGRTVALVSSGDSGIYGMAGIVLQLVSQMHADIAVEIVPGITAASAAASILGAPLMHDFAVISLSDLMTPLDTIRRRIRAAAEADFVICLYNPKSKSRTEYIRMTADIVTAVGGRDRCVGIVRHAGRPEESYELTTVGALAEAEIDMFTTVIIGNSQTRVRDGRMITPRGYPL